MKVWGLLGTTRASTHHSSEAWSSVRAQNHFKPTNTAECSSNATHVGLLLILFLRKEAEMIPIEAAWAMALVGDLHLLGVPHLKRVVHDHNMMGVDSQLLLLHCNGENRIRSLPLLSDRPCR